MAEIYSDQDWFGDVIGVDHYPDPMEEHTVFVVVRETRGGVTQYAEVQLLRKQARKMAKKILKATKKRDNT